MQKFIVPVTYEFRGNFVIEADSQGQAERYAQEHCGMVIGEISSTLPKDEVDWDFLRHPDVIVGSGRKVLDTKVY